MGMNSSTVRPNESTSRTVDDEMSSAAWNDLEVCKSRKFTGYMPKPINAPQLKKQILDILRKRITLI